MRIRNNQNASFALRYTGTNRSALMKSLEKLSSGYAINRAGDDAAGLAISEKMRRQITGLKRADKNSQEGVKLIQVGEGALDEIHNMLQRAASLANQSSNGVYEDEVDREALQAELDQLCEDIDRIAGSTNFNGVKLFQNRGLKYEGKPDSSPAASAAAQQAANVDRAQAAQSAPRRTLDDLIRDEDRGDLNIVYLEYPMNTTQTPGSGASGVNTSLDVDVNGTKISEILKTQIVPQTVHNILTNYPAFSYLKDSAIGIGMRLYSDSSSSVLASVTQGTELFSNGTGSATYTLSVNMGKVDTTKSGWRNDLESTIAHEMIHAFMFEATTAGMHGLRPGTSTSVSSYKFPSWFVEGMAQTASGPDTWIRPNSGGGLQIDANSDVSKIQSEIGRVPLGSSGGGGDYGTGYLACMYLGWKIASGGNASTQVNAANISMGLTSLMNAVIGGKSLNEAIKDQTNGAFTSTSDFQTKFNAAGTEVTGFVQNLMVARGDGRGGLASGDLKATDLTSDDPLNDVHLFELNTATSEVKNKYPDDYVITAGGTTSAGGTKPSDFEPGAVEKEYGDFIVKGNLPDDGSGGMQGITWDDTAKTLTVSSGNNITITMKSPTSGQLQNLKLEGTGTVTLNGVKADSLQVNESTQVSYEGKNDITAVTVDSGKAVTFQGEGQLKAGTFTNNGTVSFNGGAVIVGGGTGTIGGTVNVNGASVAATITNVPKAADGVTELKSIEMPWNSTSWPDKLPAGFNVASISVDGVKAGALLSNGESGKLWLDPAKNHRVTFTDSSGASKTLAATIDAAGNFQWEAAAKPFTVTGGVENTDYKYEDNGETLVILTNQVTSISGGTTTDEAGNPLRGRIKIKDGIGAVTLELGGVDCSQNAVGSGFDLGTNNTVTLTLKDGTDNKFTGAATFAGISIGTGTNLTIDGNTGTLTAIAGEGGDSGAAGIGRNGNGSTAQGAACTDDTSSITINGGVITAQGSNGGRSNPKGSGAGIGAGDHNGFGDITITGGTINATGGDRGGAGIGGAIYASCGAITINEDSGKKTTVTAISKGHGAGIGGGWFYTENGDIYISAGDITAESKTHGTGIGAGCQGSSDSTNYHSLSGKITITGDANILSAQGGDSGAGIGGSAWGACGDIEISGSANIVEARGGNSGSGIGSGSGSEAGDILINTTGKVNAYGGTNGVGIGSGYNNSTVGNIEILQGSVYAKGSTNSTGIGAGRSSTSGNITIGDEKNPNNKVIVTAEGGMTNGGGNIMSYTDKGHTEAGAGTVKIVGNGTTVRPGNMGEGLYSTSGVVGEDGKQPLYAYPVYLFHTDGTTDKDETLNAGVGLNAAMKTNNKLPLDKTKVDLTSIEITSGGKTWTLGLNHGDLDEDYVFVWLNPEDQDLTIKYDEKKVDADGNVIVGADGKPETEQKEIVLNLIWKPAAGVFRIEGQKEPPKAEKPEYKPDQPGPNPGPDPKPDPDPVTPPEEEEPGEGGIILQIGAEYGEILTVPQFYLSLEALKMGSLDISTQPNAWESMSVVRDAINRVSSIRATYGALYNRLEHNQNQLRHMTENITDAESRIRDADMAEEMMVYTKANILSQSAQAMLAQAAQQPQSVLQLLG